MSRQHVQPGGQDQAGRSGRISSPSHRQPAAGVRRAAGRYIRPNPGAARRHGGGNHRPGRRQQQPAGEDQDGHPRGEAPRLQDANGIQKPAGLDEGTDRRGPGAEKQNTDTEKDPEDLASAAERMPSFKALSEVARDVADKQMKNSGESLDKAVADHKPASETATISSRIRIRSCKPL